jgi:hypothetical protein
VRKIPNNPIKLQYLIDSKSIKELSVDFGVSTRSIYKACKKLNIKRSVIK